MTALPFEDEPSRPVRVSWLTTLTAVLVALSGFVTWGGLMYSRSVPRFEQLPPGAAAHQGGVTIALTALETRTSLDDVLGDPPERPQGALFVVATLRVLVTTTATVSCDTDLIDVAGHRWKATSVSLDALSSCYDVQPDTVTELQRVYLVPAAMVADIAGVALAPERGAARTAVLRPV